MGIDYNITTKKKKKTLLKLMPEKTFFLFYHHPAGMDSLGPRTLPTFCINPIKRKKFLKKRKSYGKIYRCIINSKQSRLKNEQTKKKQSE